MVSIKCELRATLANSTMWARHTLITSAFSHESVGHILFNGFTFYFVAPSVLGILGNTAFLCLYLGGELVHVPRDFPPTNSLPPLSQVV